jgi:hypothetical protein
MRRAAGDSGAAFLDRFLAGLGAGPHHFSFLVTDIEDALTLIKASGIEPIGANLADPDWKEAFLHPRNTHGIVIRVAQQRSATARSPTRMVPIPLRLARLGPSDETATPRGVPHRR